MKIKALILVVSISCFIGAACNQSASNTNTSNTQANVNKAAANTPANAATPEVAKSKSGKDLYTVNCMTCHKDSGKGGKVTVDGRTMDPDDITTAKMKAKSDEKLFGYIHDGIEDEGMPAFKDKMTKDEISAVVQHVRTLQQ